MQYRKILVPVDGSEASAAALGTAFALATRLDAHVEVLHVRIEPTDAIPFVGEGMSGALVQELVELTEKESAARARAARQLFERWQQSAALPLASTPTASGASVAWHEATGREADVVVRRGRLADLIVVARPAPGAAGVDDPGFATALFETGRPVLVAGGGKGRRPVPDEIGRRIVVAWNGSAEAARAVAAGLPLLHGAERVVVVGVDVDVEGRAGLDELAEYLAWHGVACDRRTTSGRGSVGESLVEVAADSDLMVMGGYSHSRLRELILGGVTRYMLEHAGLPLLVAH